MLENTQTYAEFLSIVKTREINIRHRIALQSHYKFHNLKNNDSHKCEVYDIK
jgi:hypothetical protein